MLSAAGRTQLLYGIVQDGLLLVSKFDGVVDFGCMVCHGDSFRALRGRHYRLDTKKPYILLMPVEIEISQFDFSSKIRFAIELI